MITITGLICKKDLRLFENWAFNVSVKDEKLLVHTGVEELKGIAERFRYRLPSLLNNGYSKDKFKVCVVIKVERRKIL